MPTSEVEFLLFNLIFLFFVLSLGLFTFLFLLLFSPFSFFCLTHGLKKFLGQGSNPSHSCSWVFCILQILPLRVKVMGIQTCWHRSPEKGILPGLWLPREWPLLPARASPRAADSLPGPGGEQETTILLGEGRAGRHWLQCPDRGAMLMDFSGKNGAQDLFDRLTGHSTSPALSRRPLEGSSENGSAEVAPGAQPPLRPPHSVVMTTAAF